MAHSGYLIVPIRVSLCSSKKNTEKLQQQTDTDSSSYTSLSSCIDSANSSTCSSTGVSPSSSPRSRRSKSILIDTSVIDTSYGYGYGKATQVWCGFHNKNR